MARSAVMAVATVTGLAIRELWRSFRLIGILVAYVVVAFAVTAGPQALDAVVVRLAVGLGLGSLIAAVSGAWSSAHVRAGGRNGWLVPGHATRAAHVDGWFLGLAIIALIGHLGATGVGWLAVAAVTPRADAVEFAAVAGAAVASCLGAVAIGLLAGSVLRDTAAVVATLFIGIVAVLVLVGGLAPTPLVPAAGGFAVVADFRGVATETGTALVAAGVGLATASIALGAARLAIARGAS